MSGHNRWSKIKHKKEATSSKKSKLWTKLIKEITVAAKMGGGDPDGNARLRQAVDKARAQNMPNDTIERAVKKGSGELEGVNYEEFYYEVYGPGGSALLVEIMTDNRNRTASEIRNLLNRNQGTLASSGSVAWMFKKQGVVVFDRDKIDFDRVTESAIDLGADDIREEDGTVVVITDPKAFDDIAKGLKALGDPLTAEVSMIPENNVRLEGEDAVTAVKLVSVLEDHEDVQNVYSNLDVDDALFDEVE